MEESSDNDQSDRLFQLEQAERWVKRQPFEELIATYERLPRPVTNIDNIDKSRLLSRRRKFITLITDEIKRRRDERIQQDQRHSPLGEEARHLRVCDSIPSIVIPEQDDWQDSHSTVDLFDVR